MLVLTVTFSLVFGVACVVGLSPFGSFTDNPVPSQRALRLAFGYPALLSLAALGFFPLVQLLAGLPLPLPYGLSLTDFPLQLALAYGVALALLGALFLVDRWRRQRVPA